MTLFVLFLIVVIGLFVLGYILAPKGTLTKAISFIGTAFTGIYETMQEQWHILRELVPPDVAPYMIGVFLLMIGVAAVRPGK